MNEFLQYGILFVSVVLVIVAAAALAKHPELLKRMGEIEAQLASHLHKQPVVVNVLPSPPAPVVPAAPPAPQGSFPPPADTGPLPPVISDPVTPPAPPVVAPAPAPESTADKIRRWIPEKRALGMEWNDIGFWMQTQGLQRALTPDEWAVAYAAGYPKEPERAQTGGLSMPPGFDLNGLDNGGGRRNVLAATSYTFQWRPKAGAKYGHIDLVDAPQVGLPLPLATQLRVSIVDDTGAAIWGPQDLRTGNVNAVPQAPAAIAIDPARSYTLVVQPLDGNINLGCEPRSEPQV